MGCMGEAERREFLGRFWAQQERLGLAFERHRRMAQEAAEAEADPYRKRLLAWAAQNWDLVEVLSTDEPPFSPAPGLLGAARAALPEGLREAMESEGAGGGPRMELSPEQRREVEVEMLRGEERRRTGGPCPETEAEWEGIVEGKRRSGKARITAEEIRGAFERISRAASVHDPADLP